jgi:uncharacterized protein YbjT (DUF2867 family)
MTDVTGRVLVAGSTGVLGSLVVHRLLARGVPVRALGRNATRLAALAAAGAECVSADLRDRQAVREACEGVAQIYSTVNNVMGRGASSPMRVDVDAHRSLCEGARAGGVQRIVFVSGRGMDADSSVDFFRTKHAIDAVIRASGVAYVLLRPGAFMETWVGMVVDGARKSGVAMIFGNGRAVHNYIALNDVAEYSVRILCGDANGSEEIAIGGSSDVTADQLVALVEQHLGTPIRRRRIPAPMLKVGGFLLRPFNEVASRFMHMGFHQATHEDPFPAWRVAADRFGVTPTSIESFIGALPAR